MKRTIFFFSHQASVSIAITELDRQNFGNIPEVSVKNFNKDGKLIAGAADVEYLLNDEQQAFQVQIKTGRTNGIITLS